MNIHAINRILNINNVIRKSVATNFRAAIQVSQNDSVTIDELIQSKERMNSNKIIDLAKQHKYKEIHQLLADIKGEYNPMQQSDYELPLLLQIAFSKGKLSKQQKKYKIKVIENIISNDKFNSNITFKLKNNKGVIYETSYLEEAIKHNDLALMLRLFRFGGLLSVKNKDDFLLRLNNYTADNNYNDMRMMLSILEDLIMDEDASAADEKQEQCDDEDVEADDKELKTEKDALLKQTKVYIPEYIPASIDEVGGLSKAKKDIEDCIIKPWKPEIREKLIKEKIAMPNGFLMYGPPGCGKTFITSVISKQTGYPLYSINVSSVGSEYVSKTATNLKKIFDKLHEEYKQTGVPNILFLDEIDDIGGSRQESGSPYKREDIDALLIHLNNAASRGIIVIAATNYIDAVDKALLRSGRFDKKIEITLPNKEERKDILTKLLKDKSTGTELLSHLDELAEKTEGKTPADLAKYVNNCARNVIFSDKEKITLEDFEKEINEQEAADKKPVIGFRK